MNLLKIKLDPYKDINIASLDDRPLSPYSEMNNYMKEPFLSWASKLLDTAEREINDDYSLTVVSEQFEKLFLEGMQKNCSSCKEIIAENFDVNISADKRFSFVKDLTQKYGFSFSLDKHRIPVYSELELPVDSSLIEKTDFENARLYFLKDGSLVQRIKNNSGSAIVVIISEGNKVTPIGQEKYVWEIADSDLATVANCIIDRFVKIPVIIDVTSQMKNASIGMTDKESKLLSLITEIDPFISVEDIPDIEVGKTITLKVSVFPKDYQIPDLTIVPRNSGIIAVDGLNINAVAPGSVCVDIYKSNENIPFISKSIKTFQNYFVKQIDLSLSKNIMGISQRQKVNLKLTPEDADDAALVSWSVDNPGVIRVDDEGIITTLNEGEAVITASTTRVSKSISVRVLPYIKSINLNPAHANLFVGEKMPISVSIEPNNCFDRSCRWETSDGNVAVVERSGNGEPVIRATGIGDCTIKCVANHGGSSSTCSVTVESTFKKRESSRGMLSVALILAIACVICALFTAGAVAIPLALVAIALSILDIKKHRSDLVWAIVVIAVSAVSAVLSLGIF